MARLLCSMALLDPFAPFCTLTIEANRFAPIDSSDRYSRSYSLFHFFKLSLSLSTKVYCYKSTVLLTSYFIFPTHNQRWYRLIARLCTYYPYKTNPNLPMTRTNVLPSSGRTLGQGQGRRTAVRQGLGKRSSDFITVQ